LLGGFNGVFQAQFAGDYLLDLNPRVYGSLPLATRAGVNLPGVYCDILRGNAPTETVRARTGVFFRWLEGDLRNVFEGVRERELSAREAFQLLKPRPGAAHGPESLKDPKPMIARLLYAAKSNRRRKSSSGTAAGS
ncbi:MAG TPA: ATP-grasp domain-containing protein, partial [Actinomycetota bacterium]|nr:ATP-grasp domain-containing protein [Actinomycetota bacterium]